MKFNKLFVCFIGTDGSGKSTLADTIYRRLKSRHKKVRKTYGRHQHMVSKFAIILGRKFFLRNKDMFGDYDTYLKDKRNIYQQSSIAVKLYISLIIAEYLVQVFFKVTVPIKMGYYVISDRYFYDTVINDVAVDRGLSPSQIRYIFDRYWPYVPKPDATFLVEVPEKIAMSRKKDIPSLSYLEVRNKMYNEMAFTYMDIIRLDGTLTIAELEDTVMETLNKLP